MYQNIATKVLTGECRLSYVHLSQPYANPNQQNAEPKYSVTLLIPKSDQATYNDIVKSRDAAYEAAVQNDWKGARPQLRSLLIYDGDGVRQDGSAFGPECKGHYVITASTKRKPQVVDGSNINVELAPQDIYSGMYGRVTLNFFAFNSNGNKGIGCGLGNVLKTKDGEPLAGGSTAAQDFEGVSVPAPAPAAAPAPAYAPGVVPQAAPVQAYAPGVVPQAAPVQQGYTPAAGYMNVPQQIDPITGAPLNPLPFT